MEFRWNQWNIDHIAKHGVSAPEAEAVVRSARRPWPRKVENDKWLVIGRSPDGRILQVVFLEDQGDSIYVIHARPLTDKEKRRWRRNRR